LLARGYQVFAAFLKSRLNLISGRMRPEFGVVGVERSGNAPASASNSRRSSADRRSQLLSRRPVASPPLPGSIPGSRPLRPCVDLRQALAQLALLLKIGSIRRRTAPRRSVRARDGPPLVERLLSRRQLCRRPSRSANKGSWRAAISCFAPSRAAPEAWGSPTAAYLSYHNSSRRGHSCPRRGRRPRPVGDWARGGR